MQKLPDFVPAFSHHLKPLMRDGSQFTCVRFHPRIDGGIPLDSAVESQQFRMSLKIRCSSASVFSSLCSIACGERCDLGGPFLSISAPDSAAVQTSFVKTMFSNSCLRVLFDSRQGSSSTTVVSGRSNCSSVKVPSYSNKRRVCQESLPAKRSNKSMSLPPFVEEPRAKK